MQAAALADPALDIETRVFDYEAKDVADYIDDIDATDPEIVGASAYVWSFPTFFEVARELKRRRPDRWIIFGGPSARSEMFDLPPFQEGPQFIDALVIGEGEDTFKTLISLRNRGRDGLHEIPGILASTGDGWRPTPAAELPTLDNLASPYQLGLVPSVQTALLETFRGCPLSCTFCQWGKLVSGNRVFSMDYIVRELESFASLQIPTAMIADAALNLNIRAFRNLCAAEREVGYFKNASLHSEVYPQFLTEDHLNFLREVGGRVTLGLGLQSYNTSVLGSVERRFDERRFERVVHDLLQITPYAEIEIIMGLPGDGPDSFRRTLDRALSSGAGVRVYHCLVLPDALMSRSPASFDMEFDFVNLSMISCLGWKDGAIQRMSEELTALVESMPKSDAFVWNDGFGWYFPSAAVSRERRAEAEFSGHRVDGNVSPAPVAAAPGVSSATIPVCLPDQVPADSSGDVSNGIEPQIQDALAIAVAEATSGGWQLVETSRETDVITLRVQTPAGAIILDIRPAAASAESFKIVDGVAYSYRGSDMANGELRQFESLIDRLLDLAPLAFIGASASGPAYAPTHSPTHP